MSEFQRPRARRELVGPVAEARDALEVEAAEVGRELERTTGPTSEQRVIEARKMCGERLVAARDYLRAGAVGAAYPALAESASWLHLSKLSAEEYAQWRDAAKPGEGPLVLTIRETCELVDGLHPLLATLPRPACAPRAKARA